MRLLDPRFSPSTPDDKLLALNPCFRTRSTEELTSSRTVNVVIPTESLTIKSPRLLSELSNTRNLLPATNPWAVLVVIVVIPAVASYTRVLTDAEGPTLNTT